MQADGEQDRRDPRLGPIGQIEGIETAVVRVIPEVTYDPVLLGLAPLRRGVHDQIAPLVHKNLVLRTERDRLLDLFEQSAVAVHHRME